MDWLERLKIQANDPDRATDTCLRANARNPDGTRYTTIANPPATFEEIHELEEATGLKLPEELRRVYLEVGNGGFGPGGGLLSLKSAGKYLHDWGILEAYLGFRDKSFTGIDREWFQNFLPFCSGGCDLLGVIDISNERVGFIQYEMLEDLEPVENMIEWKAYSLKSWFEAWMNGEYMMGYSEIFQKNTIDVLFNKHYAS
jgi:SMI1 / KNR4 family (SUKH-1)